MLPQGFWRAMAEGQPCLGTVGPRAVHPTPHPHPWAADTSGLSEFLQMDHLSQQGSPLGAQLSLLIEKQLQLHF